MRDRSTEIFYKMDWLLVFLYLGLILAGWVNLYAAVYNEDFPSIFDTNQKYGKQMIWILASFVIAIVILITDASFYTAFAWIIYGCILVALVLVLFFGHEVSGSKSWFRFGDFGVQPAEFAKFATALALSKYLSMLNIRMDIIKTKLTAAAILFIPATIIVLQKETGGALALLALVFVLFRQGLPGSYLLAVFGLLFLFFLSLVYNSTILLIVCLCIAVIVFYLSRKKSRNIVYIVIALLVAVSVIYGAKPAFEYFPKHQIKRINVYLGIETGKRDKAWNEEQSVIAIGSGGLTGKGFLQGTQTKYDFVPEQETDFIFCTVGEEWGFVGSVIIVGLYVTLILRLIIVAERQRSTFSLIYGYAVASVFFFHFLVNIGMTLRLVPVIGIPLPFFSYGGSSMWAFTILLFIFLKLDSNRLMIFR